MRCLKAPGTKLLHRCYGQSTRKYHCCARRRSQARLARNSRLKRSGRSLPHSRPAMRKRRIVFAWNTLKTRLARQWRCWRRRTRSKRNARRFKGGAMQFDLRDKTILITGAGRGIGRALAIGAADCGATVGALDVDPSLLQELMSQPSGESGRIVPLIADVADRSAVMAAAAKLAGSSGRLD